jgi:shikimate dehydrogenase
MGGDMGNSFDLVLFGDPVGHSLSPVIHQAALDATGLTGTYRAVQVDEAGFRRGCAALREGSWRGANVTMPHKRSACAEVDVRTDEARRAWSVNTIVVEGSRLVGHSTDIDGIRVTWEEAGLPRDVPVLVLGAGGAAAASLIAIEADDVFLSTRRLESAVSLAQGMDVEVHPVPWGTVVPGAVVVNATPLGMAEEPLPPGIVEAAAGLLDMAYARTSTPAVLTALRAGLPLASGTDLLLAQAGASFTLWTGRPAPLAAMRDALQKAQATG